VGQPSGVLQGFMVHCIIVVVYSADCCGSVALLCSRIIADSCVKHFNFGSCSQMMLLCKSAMRESLRRC